MTSISRFKCPYCGAEHHVRYQTNRYACDICASQCRRLSPREGLTYGDIFGYDYSDTKASMSPVDFYEGDPEFQQEKEEIKNDNANQDSDDDNPYAPNYHHYWNID